MLEKPAENERNLVVSLLDVFGDGNQDPFNFSTPSYNQDVDNIVMGQIHLKGTFECKDYDLESCILIQVTAMDAYKEMSWEGATLCG